MTTKRTLRPGRRSGALAVAALGLLLGGCGDEETTYSYFRVQVTLDRTGFFDPGDLPAVGGCIVTVEGAQEVQASLRGCNASLRENLGTIDFSTKATSGTFRFTVEVQDLNRGVLARGTSADLPIMVGGTTTGALVVKWLQKDGGMPAGTGGPSGQAGSSGTTDAGAP